MYVVAFHRKNIKNNVHFKIVNPTTPPAINTNYKKNKISFMKPRKFLLWLYYEL